MEGYNTHEAAKKIGVSSSTIRRWNRVGILNGVMEKHNIGYIYDCEKIDAFKYGPLQSFNDLYFAWKGGNAVAFDKLISRIRAVADRSVDKWGAASGYYWELNLDELKEDAFHAGVRRMVDWNESGINYLSTSVINAVNFESRNGIRKAIRRIESNSFQAMETSSDEVEEAAMTMIDREDIFEAIRKLKPMERVVILERFGLTGERPKLQSEIGIQNGLTRQRIFQIEKRALRKLARALEDLNCMG